MTSDSNPPIFERHDGLTLGRDTWKREMFSQEQFELAWTLDPIIEFKRGYWEANRLRVLKMLTLDVLVNGMTKKRALSLRAERGLDIGNEKFLEVLKSLHSQIRGGIGHIEIGYWQKGVKRKAKLVNCPWREIPAGSI